MAHIPHLTYGQSWPYFGGPLSKDFPVEVDVNEKRTGHLGLRIFRTHQKSDDFQGDFLHFSTQKAKAKAVLSGTRDDREGACEFTR